MANVTYGKNNYGKCNYGKCNYGKSNYGKSIMANVTEPVKGWISGIWLSGPSL